MANLNKVMLIGNLTRDVEIRHTPSNTAIGSFGIAINRKFTTKAGEQREEVTFVDCEAWGKTAEVMAQYLSRGKPVFIEGRLKFDQWEDKNGGGKRSKLSVVVDNFQFLAGKDDSGGQQQQPSGNRSQGVGNQKSTYGGVSDSEIPFSPDPPF